MSGSRNHLEILSRASLMMIAVVSSPHLALGDSAHSITDLGTLGGAYIYVSGTNNGGEVVGSLSLQINLTSSNSVQIQFTAQPNTGYVVEYRDSLSSGGWLTLVVLDPIAASHTVLFTEALDPQRPTRFYRVRDPTPKTLARPSGASGLCSVSPNSPDGEESSSLLAEDSFALNISGIKGAIPSGPLSADEAGALARRLANHRAQSLYQVQPFRKAQPARLVAGRWVWRQRRGFGAADIEARVEFAADGADPKVEVTLLDSRVSASFR